MAFNPGIVWQHSYTFIDNNRNTAVVGHNSPGALTYAEALALSDAFATALQAVSNARLDAFSVTKPYVNDDPDPAPAESEVERKLVIPLLTSIRGVTSKMEVPSPIFELEVAGTDYVDQANPLLLALVDLLVNGQLGLNNGPVTNQGTDITDAKAPYIRHRTRKLAQ